jgi:hypothetical protein
MKLPGHGKELSQLRAELAATEAELERREKQLRKELEEKLKIQAQYIERLLQSRFAVRMDSAHIVYDIVNWDGDFKVNRTYEGLRTGEGLQFRYLTHKAVTTTPHATFGEARFIDEKSSAGTSMECSQPAEAEKLFKINFPADLTSSEAGASYAFEYVMNKGALMTKEAATEAYREDPRPREGFHHVNEISTGLLQIDVIFPRGYPAKTNCAALISDAIHGEETKKLLVQHSEHGVSVRIEKPLPGFKYLIEWDGPSENDFTRLKEEASGRKPAK